MTTLLQANSEWSKRAPDERFGSLEAIHTKALSDRETGREVIVPMHKVRAIAHEGALGIQGSHSVARLTNASFAQLCARSMSAPADYLAQLPVNLAAQCLNAGLATRHEDDKAQLLVNNAVHDTGSSTLIRAFTGDRYSRIWNADITGRLIKLAGMTSFQPAPAAFDGSRGLYLGDRDMFCFMVDNDRRIFETLPGGGLSRGFFVWNSETGHRKFGILAFLYEYVCGNHRVWGAQRQFEVSVRHVGDAAERASLNGDLHGKLVEYATASASADEAMIARAREFTIGRDLDAVLDRLMGLRVPALTQKLVRLTYERAEERVDWYGAPNTAWGFTGALTEIARDEANADARFTIEGAATRILDMVPA